MSKNERRYDGTAVATVEFDPETLSEPPQKRYAPVVIVDAEGDAGWSMGMEFLADQDPDSWVKRARVDLLAEEAPHHKIVRGADFEMYEGPHRVGRVKIETSSLRIPEGRVHDRPAGEGATREMAA